MKAPYLVKDGEHKKKNPTPKIRLTGREISGKLFITAFILAEQIVPGLCSPAFPCSSPMGPAPAAHDSPRPRERVSPTGPGTGAS